MRTIAPITCSRSSTCTHRWCPRLHGRRGRLPGGRPVRPDGSGPQRRPRCGPPRSRRSSRTAGASASSHQNPRGYLRRVVTGPGPAASRAPENYRSLPELSGAAGSRPAPATDQNSTRWSDLAAAAGEPDREVESLRRMLRSRSRISTIPTLARFALVAEELTVENLLGNRLPARCSESEPACWSASGHVCAGLRSPACTGSPAAARAAGVRQIAARRERRQRAHAAARRAQRAKTGEATSASSPTTAIRDALRGPR
jgi:hypothetical protein